MALRGPGVVAPVDDGKLFETRAFQGPVHPRSRAEIAGVAAFVKDRDPVAFLDAQAFQQGLQRILGHHLPRVGPRSPERAIGRVDGPRDVPAGECVGRADIQDRVGLAHRVGCRQRAESGSHARAQAEGQAQGQPDRVSHVVLRVVAFERVPPLKRRFYHPCCMRHISKSRAGAPATSDAAIRLAIGGALCQMGETLQAQAGR